MKRLWAVVRQRCPICLEGKVFRSLWGMNTHCPVCGVKFERETGYFLNSMFIAYTLGFLILIPTAVLLYLCGCFSPRLHRCHHRGNRGDVASALPLLASHLDARRPDLGPAPGGEDRGTRMKRI